MILKSTDMFDRKALVRGWNTVGDDPFVKKDFLEALDVLILGEQKGHPGVFAVIWALYDDDLQQVMPVGMDITREVLLILQEKGTYNVVGYAT